MRFIKSIRTKRQGLRKSQNGDIDYLEIAGRRALFAFCILGGLTGLLVTVKYMTTMKGTLPLSGELTLYTFPVLFLFSFMVFKRVPVRTVAILFGVYTIARLAILLSSMGGLHSAQALFLVPVTMVLVLVLSAKEGIVAFLVTISLFTYLYITQSTGLADKSELMTQYFRLSVALCLVVSASYIYRQEMLRAVTGAFEDRKKAEQAMAEAQAANLAKSEFLATMSHEIRTPMNGVLGMAEILRGTDLTEHQEKLAEVIDRSGQALLTIINDILDFSKIEAGQLTLEAAPFDFKATVQDVAKLLTSGAAKKGIELVVNCADDVPRKVQGDQGRLRQVLTNLVGNAVKFTHEGSVVIDVTASAEDGLVAYNVRIADTGIGIPPEKITGIFEKFTQADSSTTRQYGGTGLGLSISKGLVEAMGGQLTATSEVGVGSVFTIELILPMEPATRSKASNQIGPEKYSQHNNEENIDNVLPIAIAT